MPCGRASGRFIFSMSSGRKPRSDIEMGCDFFVRRRIDTLSPYIVGSDEIRMSMSSPLFRVNPMRPSCGRRFSEMLRRAIIFMRDIMESLKRSRFSGTLTGTRFPSMR